MPIFAELSYFARTSSNLLKRIHGETARQTEEINRPPKTYFWFTSDAFYVKSLFANLLRSQALFTAVAKTVQGRHQPLCELDRSTAPLNLLVLFAS